MHNWLSRLLGYITGAFFVLAAGGLFLVPRVVNLVRTLMPEGTETASVITWLLFWYLVYLVALSLPFFTGGFLGYRYGRTKEATVAAWIAVQPVCPDGDRMLGYVTGVVVVLVTGFLLWYLYMLLGAFLFFLFHHWGVESRIASIAMSWFWLLEPLVALSLPLLAGGFLGYRYGQRGEQKK